jgi:transcriptional regulator with PAS, ATPase and Fis domain
VEEEIYKLFIQKREAGKTWHAIMQDFENAIIKYAQKKSPNNHSELARQLGLQRTTLLFKLEKLYLDTL